LLINSSDSQADQEDIDFDEMLKVSKERSGSQLLYRRETLVTATFEDFEPIKCIGRGTFGKVFLVKCKHNEKLYAMKVIRKDIVIQHDSIDSLQVEKLILLQVNHPFIIGMDYVFQKAYRIYFIMDFIQGGELFKHLSEQKRFSEEKAKFYAA
jgi:serine/threonine protein kinase